MQEWGGEDLAAGSGDGSRKQEAELRAITEDTLTEVGGWVTNWKGESEIQGDTQRKLWSHHHKQSSVEGDQHRTRNACLLSFYLSFEVVTDHRNIKERLGVKGAEDSGVRLGNPPAVSRGAHPSPRWSPAGGRDLLSFPSLYSQCHGWVAPNT